VSIPVWLTIAVACLVGIFGVYRLRLAFRSQEQDEKARARGGLYGMPRRTHALFGVLYLIMAALLLGSATGLINSPFR
jgi:hypothetical protein